MRIKRERFYYRAAILLALWTMFLLMLAVMSLASERDALRGEKVLFMTRCSQQIDGQVICGDPVIVTPEVAR